MGVLLNEDGLVPALKEMAGTVAAVVEKLRIDAVQLAHAEGEVSVRGLQEQMVMVVHEAVGMAQPVIAFLDVLKRPEEHFAVLIVLEDGLLLVAARGDVIDGAGIFDAKRTGHGAKIAAEKANVNSKDLTPRIPVLILQLSRQWSSSTIETSQPRT